MLRALRRWLQEDSAKPSQPLNTSIVQRLQRFGTWVTSPCSLLGPMLLHYVEIDHSALKSTAMSSLLGLCFRWRLHFRGTNLLSSVGQPLSPLSIGVASWQVRATQAGGPAVCGAQPGGRQRGAAGHAGDVRAARHRRQRPHLARRHGQGARLQKIWLLEQLAPRTHRKYKWLTDARRSGRHLWTAQSLCMACCQMRARAPAHAVGVSMHTFSQSGRQ